MLLQQRLKNAVLNIDRVEKCNKSNYFYKMFIRQFSTKLKYLDIEIVEYLNTVP